MSVLKDIVAVVAATACLIGLTVLAVACDSSGSSTTCVYGSKPEPQRTRTVYVDNSYSTPETIYVREPAPRPYHIPQPMHENGFSGRGYREMPDCGY